MANPGVDEYLKNIYYDPEHPAAFSGVDKLYRFVKSDGQHFSKARVKKWLSSQKVYTKHKPVRHNFKRTRVVVPTKLYQFDADTVSMKRYEKYNKGYKHILIMIDILSRYAWTHPLKSLTGKEMVQALKSTITKVPKRIRCDLGSEFANAPVKRYLKLKGIHMFHTLNEKKANYAERLIQTVKSKITKYLQYTKTFNWVDILPKITESYNSGYHRSMKMSPAVAMKTDDPTLWISQYGIKPKPVKKEQLKPPRIKSPYKFKLGDKVKLTFNRSTFDRAYDEKWTDEYFIITARGIKQGFCLYNVKDFNNDPVRGSFYDKELQKIDMEEDETTMYDIEKIIRKRVRRGKKEVLVKWIGWHRKFNTWIPASEVKDI